MDICRKGYANSATEPLPAEAEDFVTPCSQGS